MSLLNRSTTYAHMYDSEGRLQGGLSGLEELAQVIALNSGNDRPNEATAEGEDDSTPARDFPIRSLAEFSSPSTLDSDEDMDSEAGSSDDETMEEIAMYDEPQLSPTPDTKALPQITSNMTLSPESSLAPESDDGILNTITLDPSAKGTSSPDSEASGIRFRPSRRGSRKSSRRRTTIEGLVELLPIGEQLKCRLLEENVVGLIIVGFDIPCVQINVSLMHRTYFLSFLGTTSCTVPSTILCIRL